MSILLRSERESACEAHAEKSAANHQTGEEWLLHIYPFKNSLGMYILQTTAGKLSLYSISVEFPQSIKP
jgi:hypothetical protein